MQRKKLLIAVLAMALLIGTVSATVLTYYGRITGTVTVSQAVTLDGLSMPESWAITEVVSGVAGSSIPGNVHNLVNGADKKIMVNLVSTPTDAAYKVYPEYKLDAWVDDDALYVVLNDYIAWQYFGGLSFDYFITYDGGNKWIPQCNRALRDSEGTVKYYASAVHKVGTVGVRTSMTYNKADFTIYNLDWTTIADPSQEVLNPLTFKYFVMQAGYTAVDPNPSEAQQIAWPSNFAFPGRDIIGIALPTATPYGPVLQLVEFRMIYAFVPAASKGDYTIVTNVVPLGFGP